MACCVAIYVFEWCRDSCIRDMTHRQDVRDMTHRHRDICCILCSHICLDCCPLYEYIHFMCSLIYLCDVRMCLTHMYVYIYMYVYTSICVSKPCMYTYVSGKCVRVYMYVYIYTYTCTYTHVLMSLRMYVYTSV